MRKILLLTVLGFFAGITTGLAQFSAGIGGFVLKPLGGFAQNVANSGGINLNAAYRFTPVHIETGFDASLCNYAHHTDRVPYTAPKYQHTEADRERASGVNIYNVFAKVYATQQTIVQPYVDLRMGISHFTTTEEFTDPFRNHNQSCKSPPVLKHVTTMRDNAFNYGFGGGFQIDLKKLVGKDDEDMTFLFDCRAIYLHGGVATYRNIANNPDPRDARGNYTTRTDMLLINFCLKISIPLGK